MAQRPSGDGWTVSDPALWDTLANTSEYVRLAADHKLARFDEYVAHRDPQDGWVFHRGPDLTAFRPDKGPDFSTVRAIHARPLGSGPAKEGNQ